MHRAADEPYTPILDWLLWEASTGGIRRGRHCLDELQAHPGEVHPCAHDDPDHGGDHVSEDGHLRW
jgi:hypothetical protein